MLDLILAAVLAQAASPDPCQALPLPAPAQGCRRWRSIGRDHIAELLLDPATLQREGRSFDVLTRVVFAAPQDGGVRSLMALSHYDCANRTWAIRHSTYYNAEGILLGEADSSGEARPASAGGPNAHLLDDFCDD